MFQICIHGEFHASHHVKLPDGTLEEPHAHDWLVRVYLWRDTLNELGMVADFHEAQDALSDILSRLNHTDLNEHTALQNPFPTAEIVAKFISDAMSEKEIAPIFRVEVTEAPGCIAIFEPPGEA